MNLLKFPCLPTILPTSVALATLYSVINILSTSAQIVPDNSLGNENSVVTPNVNIRGINSDRIDGGAVRGSNLFHSFQEFNIREGRGAYFSNPDNIINILTRVTGGNISEILGTLGVLGNANLFLINPAGIVFGPNARLDVGGSFFATTADGVLFENGFEFAASNPEAPPLLTINMPLGLNIRENPGAIVNRARQNNNFLTTSGLSVPSEQTIALIGGEIRFESGVVASPGSRLELGGLSEPGIVELNPDGSFNFPLNVQRANIILTNGAVASVVGNPGGNIAINVRNLEISGGSQVTNGVAEVSSLPSLVGEENLDAEPSKAGDILINATESVRLTDQNSGIGNEVFPNALGNAGNIDIQTNSLSVSNGAFISTAIFGNGDGGDLTVTANDVELLSGSQLAASVQPGATGNGGTITLDTQNLSVREGAVIFTGTFGEGDGGNLTVTAKDVELVGGGSRLRASVEQGATGNGGTLTLNTQNLSIREGAQIQTGTSGNGDGGNLTVTANEVELVGTGSQLGASVQPEARGNGGTLTLNTQNLSIREGAQIQTGTSGNGDGGNLTVTANEVELVGSGSALGASVALGATGNGGTLTLNTQRLLVRDGAQIGTPTFGEGDGGNLTVTANDVELVGSGSQLGASVQPGATGNGGTLTVDTQRLSVRDGAQIQTGTFGNGNGGNLTVTANDVELVGISADGQFPSILSALVEPNARGNGGTLTVNTQRLSVRDGAQIATGTLGEGDGGNLTVTANDVELVGSGSVLEASVQPGATGNGGTLTLNTQNLSVREGAVIFTGTIGNGDGGNLTVTANDVELVGSGSVLGASVQPNARGNGGTLTVNTQRLSVREGAQIQTDTFGNGDGGNLNVTANDVELVGSGSGLGASVQPEATGNGGTLTVNTQRLSVREGAQISTTTFGNGNAGNLTVTATDIEMVGSSSQLGAFVVQGATGNGGTLTVNTQRLSVREGAKIFTGTLGNGDGGNLTITANDVELVGTSADGQIVSEFGSSVEQGATGNGGTLTLDTQRLSVREGASIFTGTFGNGDGGNLTITANDVELVGSGSGLAASVQEGGIGNGGALTLNTQRLSVREGALIFTGTLGNGDGGNLTVTATDVELVGRGGLAASAFFTSTGRAGTLTVNAENLTVRDGATIDVRSETSEPAGNLVINAPSILLNNQASLNANTTAGQGNIIVNTNDLRLRNNSNITTNATGEATGGNIVLNANTLVAIEDSDISANAQAAFGGQVIVNANAIFGTQFRQQSTGASDITATSELGAEFSGTVQLNSEIDPAQGLVDLPQTVVDPAALIAQDPCKLGRNSSFIITGRGGIAFNPTQDLFAVPELELSLIEPVTPSVNRSSQRRSQQSKKRDNNTVDSRTIVPARGWIRDEKGDVILVGYDPTKTGVQRQPQPLPNQCNSEE